MCPHRRLPRRVRHAEAPSTTRQIGGVLGTAVLGALLSARLSSTLHSEAEKRAGRLPEQLRTRFIDNSAAAGQHFRPDRARGRHLAGRRPLSLPPREPLPLASAGAATEVPGRP
ncbi:hypothetical protein SBI_07262 [Streptomyces bingchenggensis BCW-1]|uniref:Uncharacterized protein n=1 Tax=Streptomyces bingchenggensis (strain BCW-1) TaxID=749414 RepID=D7C5J4_STRBB|nr:MULTISPECIES: hypothetical protein [Streptomyces]ADI10382.1 hypothetical protein SBI_07262 [Streptomyces bingchenggensis BCW-1]